MCGSGSSGSGGNGGSLSNVKKQLVSVEPYSKLKPLTDIDGLTQEEVKELEKYRMQWARNLVVDVAVGEKRVNADGARKMAQEYFKESASERAERIINSAKEATFGHSELFEEKLKNTIENYNNIAERKNRFDKIFNNTSAKFWEKSKQDNNFSKYVKGQAEKILSGYETSYNPDYHKKRKAK